MFKKRWALILAVMLLCMSSVDVYAATQDEEPDITITTDSKEYGKNDDIVQTITINNTTSKTLYDIGIWGMVPKGYKVEYAESSSGEWSIDVADIPAGKSVDVEITFISEAGIQFKNGLTIGIAVAAVVILVVAFILLRKKKVKKIISMIIVATMIASLFSITAKADDFEEEEDSLDDEYATMVTVDGNDLELIAEVTYKMADIISYEGYKEVWKDEFDADKLNRDDWNVELHDPGWVNEEWQAYVDTDENIYIKDGKLVLKPIKSKDAEGNDVYTSGRVNTQNKHDFTYGIFEARVKVPKGKGYLPAFWLMSTDENVYGQWPRCGEVDIMEIHGSETTTNYGTIHYGEPHAQSQGMFKLDDASYAEEYHTFAVEWLPGKINWFVDGKLYHSESDWYSKTEGQGTITYPAPFDQPFYIILNLAVGGSWVGYPDDTTDFEKEAYEIDYVKVYQKASYDENVKKPEKVTNLREPDAEGNYIINGTFADAENLSDNKAWKYLETLGGRANVEIKDNEIVIDSLLKGTAEYSVQLVQADIPVEKGSKYRISFDAYASKDRIIKVGVSAPDLNFLRYFGDDVVELTTEKKTYEFEFTMEEDSDPNGRLEFNMGSMGVNAAMHISNVRFEKLSEADSSTADKKNVLADGNHVYNGKFQEGDNHLGFWDIDNSVNAEVRVTDFADGRRLRVDIKDGVSKDKPLVVSQTDLAVIDGKEYALSFKAQGESGKSLDVVVDDMTYTAELSFEEKEYETKFIEAATKGEKAGKISIVITEPGTYFIDEVRLVENSLIKNGDFSAGFAGYEKYAYKTEDVTWVVDSLNEDNAADYTINNTGDQAWHIQLKQNGIELEKDQWYKLSIEAKCNVDRKLMFAIQRDGSKHNDDWTPYSGEKIVDLTSDYQTFTIEFQMTEETDLQSVLSISMGAVDGKQIDVQHRICIDNITLEKIEK